MPRENSRLPRFSHAEMGQAPLIDLVGNRQVTVEGSTGILLYENENIKLSAGRMILSFHGRGLRLRCVSGSCVEISGFISKLEFLT